MVAAREAMLRENFADQRAQPPFGPVTHHRIAKFFGCGNAISRVIPISITARLDKQQKCGARHPDARINREELGTPRQAAQRNRLRPTGACGHGRDGHE